jgi:hypothetical protein
MDNKKVPKEERFIQTNKKYAHNLKNIFSIARP